MLNRVRQLPRSLFFLFAGTIITRMGAFVFPYLTIYLADARQFGFEEVGLVLSVGSLGLLLGNLSGGWLTDRWSRKWTLILALLLNAAGFTGLAFEYASPWVYAAYLFVGYVGSGMYTPAANTLIADLTDEERRPFAYTVNYVCINLGMGLGPLLGGILAEVGYHWLFIGDVASSLICAVLIGIGLPAARILVSDSLVSNASRSEASTSASPAPNRFGVWWQHRSVLAFCLSYFFLIAPLMGLEYAVPLLIKKEFHASVVYVGLIYSINAAEILAFSFFIQRLIHRRDEHKMMVLAGAIWTIGMLTLLIGFSIPALMICTAVWTVGEIVASILVPSFVAKNVPNAYKGRFMAIIDLVRSFAGVIFPIGLGFVWKYYSANRVVLILTVIPAVGTFVYLALSFLRQLKSTKVSTIGMEATP